MNRLTMTLGMVLGVWACLAAGAQPARNFVSLTYAGNPLTRVVDQADGFTYAGAKELDRENGLDLYDSRARWYDPLLGRTTTQDPLAEKYPHLSPYLWCAGNPIMNFDKKCRGS